MVIGVRYCRFFTVWYPAFSGFRRFVFIYFSEERFRIRAVEKHEVFIMLEVVLVVMCGKLQCDAVFFYTYNDTFKAYFQGGFAVKEKLHIAGVAFSQNIRIFAFQEKAAEAGVFCCPLICTAICQMDSGRKPQRQPGVPSFVAHNPDLS